LGQSARGRLRQDARVYVHSTRVRTTDRSVGDSSILAEEMLTWLRQIEGFEGMMMIAREDTVIGLSFWRSEEIAERHLVARMEFIQRLTSVVNVEIEETVGYEVTFASLNDALAEVRAPATS
jgi:hypothetical protein